MSQMELNLMSRMLGMRMDINLILPEGGRKRIAGVCCG